MCFDELFQVYWDGDMIWYHGQIYKYDEASGSYGVRYDDGTTGEEDLLGETRVRLFLNAGFQCIKSQYHYGTTSEGLPFSAGTCFIVVVEWFFFSLSPVCFKSWCESARLCRPNRMGACQGIRGMARNSAVRPEIGWW